MKILEGVWVLAWLGSQRNFWKKLVNILHCIPLSNYLNAPEHLLKIESYELWGNGISKYYKFLPFIVVSVQF